MKNLLIILFLFSVLFSFGQEEKKYNRIISMSELEEMLIESEDKDLMLRDTYIKLDMEVIYSDAYKYGRKITGKDAKYYEPSFNTDGNFQGWRRKGIDSLSFKSAFFIDCMFDEINFENCKEGKLTLTNCTVNNQFSLSFCDFELGITGGVIKTPINIWKCNFESFSLTSVNTTNNNYANASRLLFRNSSVQNTFSCSGNFNRCEIYNSSFHQNFSLSGSLNRINVFSSSFHNGVSLSGVYAKERVSFQLDTFFVDSNLFYRYGSTFDEFGNSIDKEEFDDTTYYPSVVSFWNSEFTELSFEKNSFLFHKDLEFTKSNVYNYSITDSEIEELSFSNETIERINFNGTKITNSFSFDSTIINTDFSAKGIGLPEYNVDFTWELLKSKLIFFIDDSTNYQGLTEEELANEKLYNDYITSYKKFFSVFKNKGDLKSANACYAEMKDVETRRLKHLSETEGGIDNLLNYQLNVFLKYFAEYGTSPIKSVKISGWVILIFAFFYFFFYSAWDKINRKFLIDRGEKLLSYFNSEQKLEELYSDKHKEDLSTYTQFKHNLKESKAQVPFFFMLFLKPLYWVAVLKLKGNKALYKRIEFLQGRWVDLTAGKKLLIGSFTFLTILTYGFYLIAIRSLNSLILSINTFTTLGFGDIPVVGISRYVAILEGFLGWFLLSIFSVSLISQILQN